MSLKHRICCFSYVGMAVIALLLYYWLRDESYGVSVSPGPYSVEGWVMAFGLILSVHLLARFSYRFQSMREASRDAYDALGPLTPAIVFVLALFSSVGEELLFRGFLLNETGIWISSLLFGLVHWPPNKNWMLWPLFAFVLGLALAWIALRNGSVFYPVIIHFGINYFNLRLIADFAKGSEAG